MRALAILIIVFLFSSSKSWSQEEKSDSFDDLSGSKWPVGGSQRDTFVYDDQSEMYVSDPVEDSISFGRGQGEVTEKQCARFAKRSVKRMDKLTARVRKTNDAYLAKFKESENALMQRLCFINEQSAEGMMQDAWYSFNRFENICGREGNNAPKGYFAELDTLTQATNYMSRQGSVASGQSPVQSSNTLATDHRLPTTSSCPCSGLSDIKAANARLKKELKRSEMNGQYIGERKAQLQKICGKEQILDKQLKGLYETNHYFKQQLADNKELFGQTSRFEKMLMNRLNSIPEFGQFMSQYGEQAWRNGPNVNNPAAYAGKVLKWEELAKASDIVQAGDSEDNTAKAAETAGVEELAQASDNKDKYNKADSTASKAQVLKEEKDKEKVPGAFKTNPLKTKRFVDRLRYNANLQMDGRTLLFPASGTWSMQVGYQYHTRGQIGVGGNYIFGMGRNFSHFETKNNQWLRHNGLGLRAFSDFQLRGLLYANVAYERNLRLLEGASLNKLDTYAPSQWLNSALVGLKIKYPGGKKGQQTLEISYDLLSKGQRPALVTRVGWQF